MNNKATNLLVLTTILFQRQITIQLLLTISSNCFLHSNYAYKQVGRQFLVKGCINMPTLQYLINIG